MSLNINSPEGLLSFGLRIHAVLISDKTDKKDEMSAELANIMREFNLVNENSPRAKFIRAKRIVHETLRMHCIVPLSNEKLPSDIQVACNCELRYRCKRYNFLIDVQMLATKDRMLFLVINLENTQDSFALIFSYEDVDNFMLDTDQSIIRREEKYDYLHQRIKSLLDTARNKKLPSTLIPYLSKSMLPSC